VVFHGSNQKVKRVKPIIENCPDMTPSDCLVIDMNNGTFKYGVGCYRTLIGNFNPECCEEICIRLHPVNLFRSSEFTTKGEEDDVAL